MFSFTVICPFYNDLACSWLRTESIWLGSIKRRHFSVADDHYSFFEDKQLDKGMNIVNEDIE